MIGVKWELGEAAQEDDRIGLHWDVALDIFFSSIAMLHETKSITPAGISNLAECILGETGITFDTDLAEQAVIEAGERIYRSIHHPNNEDSLALIKNLEACKDKTLEYGSNTTTNVMYILKPVE